MDELQRQVDAQASKLDREFAGLEQLLETPAIDETHCQHVEILLIQAKRVRREAAALVRALARLRDAFGES